MLLVGMLSISNGKINTGIVKGYTNPLHFYRCTKGNEIASAHVHPFMSPTKRTVLLLHT